MCRLDVKYVEGLPGGKVVRRMGIEDEQEGIGDVRAQL